MKLKSSLSLILLIFNLTFIFNSGEAGKILFYTPFAAKSYKITFTPILEELSKWVSKFFKVKTFHERVVDPLPLMTYGLKLSLKA